MTQLSVEESTVRGAGRVAEDLSDRCNQFADLSGYPFKKRLLIRAADLVFYCGINLIGRTVRFEVEGWEHWEAASRDGCIPIYASWHDGIILATYFWQRRDLVVMTSQSYDGEYIARFIQRFGYGTARGSSTRGSVGAVIEMIRLMGQGRPVGFAIDGPKGPRHVAKMGAVWLAKKTGHPILPFTITPARFWSLTRSWDAMRISKPFTRARVEIAAPIFVAPDADESEMAARRDELQAALDELGCRGEQWSARSRLA